MMATLVLPEWIGSQLAHASQALVETAGVLVAGIARSGVDLRLIARNWYEVQPDDYDIREGDRLQIPSRAYVEALRAAETEKLCAIFVHTHPGPDGIPTASECDYKVDELLQSTFRIRTGSNLYASLVLSSADSWFRFTGRGIDDENTFVVDRLLIVGERLALLSAFDAPELGVDQALFDRNVRAFGSGVQSVLRSLRIGIVGCGGTGSAVAEQLTRLGCRSLLLIDPDTLADSNLTRVYGSTLRDVGRPKPDILAAHLRRIAPDADIETRTGSILGESAARSLTACDVLFGCTDDNAGRLVLTRLSAFYLIPLFDCGVLISSTGGSLTGIHARVTIQTAGTACLVCRGRIDLARAAAEQLPETERDQLAREGYAPELGGIEPAVVTFTTAVAAQAVTELLDRLIGFGPVPLPSEILLRIHDREIGYNNVQPKAGHLCHPSEGSLGLGDQTPFVGVLWGYE